MRRLAAFTLDPAGGNPAGVLVSPVHPLDDEMQQIAAEIGYSETAFVAAAGDGGRRYAVRYFSPQVEVPFCGHATIAAGVALADQVGLGAFTFLTMAGPVRVDVGADELGRLLATLTSPPPRWGRSTTSPSATCSGRWTGARRTWIPSLPPARASAGAAHLVVAVRQRARLANLDYDFDLLRSIMLAADLLTLHLVWRESSLRYHARAPFPVGGVVEDPATGAASAAFGAYLRRLGAASAPCTITLEQGHDMGRPSTVLVELVPDQDPVRVSGHAVPIV